MTKKQLIKEYGKTILNLTLKELTELVLILLDISGENKNIISLVKNSITGTDFKTDEWDTEFIYLEFDVKRKYPYDGCVALYTFRFYRNLDVTINDYSGYPVQINNIVKYLETIKKMVENEN